MMGLVVNKYLKIKSSDGTIVDEIRTTSDKADLLQEDGYVIVDNTYDFEHVRGKIFKLENEEIIEVGANPDVEYIDSKQSKIDNVKNITVTISTGKEFDGDEISQDRMVRAITIAQATGQTSTYWKLTNNQTVEVTLPELVEALALSGQTMSTIWLQS